MSATHDSNELKKLALFKGLDSDDLSWVNDEMICKEYRGKRHLMLASQPGDRVYIIQSGTIKIHVEQSDGTDVTLAILGIGDIVGEMSLMDQAGRSANAVTLERSMILSMNRTTFQECIRKIPQFTENMFRILSRRLRIANEQIQALSRLDVHGRVARILVTFAEQYGENGDRDDEDIKIPIRLTQSDIASLVGATRERVNKVMVDYKERKHITVDSKHYITVHNKRALVRRSL